MNFDNLVEDAETDDAFELAVIELLGPAALTGGKLNAYEIAKMFWDAAITHAQPTPAQTFERIIEESDGLGGHISSYRLRMMADKLRKGEPL